MFATCICFRLLEELVLSTLLEASTVTFPPFLSSSSPRYRCSPLYPLPHSCSLEENLSEERVERQRQEKQAQRLRGALQHMLSDGNSLNRFGSTPNAPSKEPRSPSPDTSLQRHAWGVDEASDTAVESGQTAVLGLVRAYEIDTRTPTD